jgi:succinate-semialdehyde dehydrogenase/glutarate-semialdehyde dehydrogenase
MGLLGERAGLPKGILSVITSKRSSDIGKEFCENPIVRKLTFTGSTEVGRILLRQAADQVMKCSMELGGNAPFIVFDDADLDAAVAGAMMSKFRNNGQTCVCANRIYVQAGVYDAFAEKLRAAVAKARVGDGLSETVEFGPLINAAAVEKVEEHIADATAKGARIELGGGRHELGGNFFQPTILTGVTDEMLVTTEETFGPLAPLFRFETEEEVIAKANATIFGLASYFYARDIGRVTRVQEAAQRGDAHGRGLRSAQGLDLGAAFGRHLRQHQPPDRGSDAREGAARGAPPVAALLDGNAERTEGHHPARRAARGGPSGRV